MTDYSVNRLLFLKSEGAGRRERRVFTIHNISLLDNFDILDGGVAEEDVQPFDQQGFLVADFKREGRGDGQM